MTTTLAPKKLTSRLDRLEGLSSTVQGLTNLSNDGIILGFRMEDHPVHTRLPLKRQRRENSGKKILVTRRPQDPAETRMNENILEDVILAMRKQLQIVEKPSTAILLKISALVAKKKQVTTSEINNEMGQSQSRKIKTKDK